jgi:hypothetical protein
MSGQGETLMFQASSAARTLTAALSVVNGGRGGRLAVMGVSRDEPAWGSSRTVELGAGIVKPSRVTQWLSRGTPKRASTRWNCSAPLRIMPSPS